MSPLLEDVKIPAGIFFGSLQVAVWSYLNASSLRCQTCTTMLLVLVKPGSLVDEDLNLVPGECLPILTFPWGTDFDIDFINLINFIHPALSVCLSLITIDVFQSLLGVT